MFDTHYPDDYVIYYKGKHVAFSYYAPNEKKLFCAQLSFSGIVVVWRIKHQTSNVKQS